MGRYTDMMGASPTASNARRVSDIVAALAPPAPAGTTAVVKANPAHESPSFGGAVVAAVPMGVGAAAGAFMWKKHRILGAFAGAMVGSSVPSLLKANERTNGLCQIGIAGTAVVGSKMWKKHPIGGFIVGEIVGAIVATMVPGSYQNKVYSAWKTK